MDYKKTLTELTAGIAVSGYENTITGCMSKKFKLFCDSVEVDDFYNVIGFKEGCGKNRKRIMVTAHIDEIGLMVKSIDEKGFIRFTNIGGIDSRILLAQEVTVHGKKDVDGIIGAKPPHLLDAEETKNAVKMRELSIDTGMSSEELGKYVSIGDMVSFKAQPFVLNSHILSSKSIDNRCGVTALVAIMEEMSSIKHESDLYFVSTTQEEVKLGGAINTSYKLNPDIALVIDACHGDMPDAPKERTCKLGKGPAVGIGPNLHKGYTKKVKEVAKDESIPYQVDVEPGNTGTEAWAIQVSRSGIPTVLLSIPVRYMHTPVETVHLDDIKHTAKLAARFITQIRSQ